MSFITAVNNTNREDASIRCPAPILNYVSAKTGSALDAHPSRSLLLHVLGVNTVPYPRLTVRRLLSETYCYLVVTGRAAAIGHDTNMSSFEFWHRHQHSRVNVGLLSRKIWIPLATHQIGG